MKGNKISHKRANLRLWDKGPKKQSDGSKTQDDKQELRFSQYGQYIKEKLGLFKKPNSDYILFKNQYEFL